MCNTLGMTLLKHPFGQAHEKDNELENSIAEERRDKGAPTPSQSGRRPKIMEGIIRLGFEGESLIFMQHLATTTPR